MVKNLLKDGVLYENDWVRYEGDADDGRDLGGAGDASGGVSGGGAASGRVIFPLSVLVGSPELVEGFSEYAVSVCGGDDVAALGSFLGGASFVAVDFPNFHDGRGYSLARQVRRDLGWRGELRAIGNVLADQYGYMLECGFDAFEIDVERQSAALFAVAAESIGLKYQAAPVETRARDIRRLRHP